MVEFDGWESLIFGLLWIMEALSEGGDVVSRVCKACGDAVWLTRWQRNEGGVAAGIVEHRPHLSDLVLTSCWTRLSLSFEAAWL